MIWGAYMEMDKEKKRVNICTFGCLGLGAIIGCLIFLGCIMWSDFPILEYGLEDFQISSMLNTSDTTFIIYICRRRILQWGSLLAVWCISSYYVAVGGYNLLLGVYYGFVLTDLFIKFGIKGIPYGLVCFLPHYIFSFGAVYCMGIWFGNVVRKEVSYYYDHVKKMQYFVKIFVVLLLLYISVIIEIKFQNYFYQYLV